jgi:hypothetical protein
VGAFAHPGNVSVGPNQHGSGSRNQPQRRKLPRTIVGGVDQSNPICPRGDVEVAAALGRKEQVVNARPALGRSRTPLPDYC